MSNNAFTQFLPKKIGIVIPAHNETDSILFCLDAIKQAVTYLPTGVAAHVIVVLDSCIDDTLAKVQQANIDYLSCDFRCVGKVRDLGIRSLIAQGADWIACTDADSTVEPDWLLKQIAHLQAKKVSMICGVVSIDSWHHLSEMTKEKYIAHYKDSMGHTHIHGANLSFNSQDYIAVGGFDALACHEDVGLVKKFEQSNLPIIWSNAVRVITSSRLNARADEGFAYFLKNLENSN